MSGDLASLGGSKSSSAAKTESKPGARLINWRNALFFLFVHLIAILALFPWFFSWTGVALFVLGIYVFGMVGINIGYHRLFTHRGFTCPSWLERTIAILGCCCGQEAPAYWAAVHRRHHHHADGPEDPHSPRRGFFWGHVGWLLVKDDILKRQSVIDRYARDLRRDPFQAWLISHDHWIHLFFVSWLAFFTTGFGGAALMGAGASDAVQFGLSLMVWAGAVRTALVWHLTWIVNSADHLWGYRNYETRDDSRNSMWTGILCNGDGWHNNHHADPRSARHGHMWWEFDLSWLTIRLMMVLGLATNVALPSPMLAEKFNGTGRPSAPEFDSFEDESLAPPTSDVTAIDWTRKVATPTRR